MLYISYCNHIDSFWIETALQNWTDSLTHFVTAAANSLVAYDEDTQKAIIFGGSSIFFEWNHLYVYDFIEDSLSIVAINWNFVKPDRYLLNPASTSAVIIDSIMYFATSNQVSKLDLAPVYEYDVVSSNFDIKPEVILQHDLAYQYAGYGCVVTDDKKQYLIISGMHSCLPGNPNCDDYKWSTKIITYHINSGEYRVVGESRYEHLYAACVVMDNIFYIIGGISTNKTEYLAIDLLVNYGYSKLLTYKGEIPWNGSASAAVIQDDASKLIYLLGGYKATHRIYKMNVVNQTIELLDIILPYPILESTTILFRPYGRIYLFRGWNGQYGDRVEFTTNTLPPFPETTPAVSDSATTTNSVSDGLIISPTMQIVVGILIIGTVCICCTVAIGLYCIYRIKQTQENADSKGEHLMKVDYDNPEEKKDDTDLKEEDKGDEYVQRDEGVEMVEMVEIEGSHKESLGKIKRTKSTTSSIMETVGSDSENDHDAEEKKEDDEEHKDDEDDLVDKDKDNDIDSDEEELRGISLMEKISDEKVNELYEIYLKSKLDCFGKCESMGFTDDMIEELFDTFEQFNAFEQRQPAPKEEDSESD